MSAINRPPLGLQGLLGSQNFGVNPSELLQGVTPTLDLLPFFGTQLLRSRVLNAGRTSPGSLVDIPVSVDDDSVWMLLGVSMYLPNITGAGGPHTLQGRVALRDLNTNLNTDLVIHTSTIDTVKNVDEWSTGFMLPDPIILENDIKIRFSWSQCDLVNADGVNCGALYFNLPA